MNHKISRWIVFLLAIRPPLNQLRGDTALLEIGSFKVSVLAVWSLCLIVLTLVRLDRGAQTPSPIRRAVIAYLAFVFVFGVPRILVSEALVTDVLIFIQFFTTALVAPAVIRDVGIDYVVRSVAAGTLLLVVMHATAAGWAPEREVVGTDIGDAAYLGAFGNKHAAASSFFVVIPFLVCGALRDRRSMPALLLLPTVLFIALTFQRTSMVSLAVFGVACVFVARRIRLVLPLVFLTALVLATLPTERVDEFIEAKVTEELDAMRAGDVEAVGANRVGIALLAANWYFDQSDLFEQLFGRGTAQAYQLHFLVVGTMTYAHIQLVELMIDYGLIGTGLALLILFRIGRFKMRALRYRASHEELVGMSMLVVVFAQLFFAMPLQDGGTCALMAFWLFPSLSPGIPRSNGGIQMSREGHGTTT